ncbi:BTAD domain-containing putative transcriptional regulator [Tsukamurella sp. 8F]|uniref:AfsR/SARP family transcriptional regulator n=1 Tax=unclassified Tsukamurella TaxID=2633480 RepID=UPI0023B9A91D|nr:MULTISPECIES: BTAD domain-containing putative transcriptional regulator [unclassified Tsukamurella]MDF0530487.1 BTAD domain-containing putative transcriptional regulator [Tsukamurella sp. 8J]MDF0587692.1 BTAD domain-containing putative transcriptional regulator [Tsukamurella sp. 8F]
MELNFKVLTRVGVDIGDGALQLGSGHASTILALFISRPGYTFAVHSIADAVWGPGRHPTSADGSLQVYISKLRRTLAEAGDGAPEISGGTGWYRFDFDPNQSDIGRFRSYITQAEGAYRRSIPGAADLYRHALSEITGDILAGLPATPFTTSFRAGVHELALDAELKMLDIGWNDVTAADATTRLTELALAQPYNERIWSSLIDTLIRSGRRAEALLAAQRLHHILSSTLGLDVHPHITDLLRDITPPDHNDNLQPRHSARPLIIKASAQLYDTTPLDHRSLERRPPPTTAVPLRS